MEEMHLIVDNVDSWMDYANIILPTAVTIIGFVLNIIITKRSIKDTLKSKRADVWLEKMTDVPVNISNLFDLLLKGVSDSEVQKKFKEIADSIFAYGSEDAIKILSEMQQTIYTTPNEGQTEEYSYKLMAYIVLLSCQIKFDITGGKINPEYWFKIKITDYNEKKEIICSLSNGIVKELDLKDFLYIESEIQ